VLLPRRAVLELVDTTGMAALAGHALVDIVLHEGRNRIVRRMFDALGHPMLRLVRTSIGPVKPGEVRVGRHRRLNPGEVGALFKLVEGEPNRDSRARR
jgi:23S rRNA pseudouridine2605 synthase